MRNSADDIAALQRAETLNELIEHFGSKRNAWNAYVEHERRIRGNPGTRPTCYWLLAVVPDHLRPRPRPDRPVFVRDEEEAVEHLMGEIRADIALRDARERWLERHGDAGDVVPPCVRSKP